MGTIITITIIILNILSIFILFKMLTGTDTKFKIITMIVLLAIVLILSNIIFGISSAGISAEMVSKAKPYMLFTLFPINVMVMAVPIAIKLSKLHFEEIKKEEFIKKVARLILIDIVLLVIECIYLKNIQMGIIK